MEQEDKIQQITEDFLSRLQIEGSVSAVIDETGAYQVHIETLETGLLIGYHGRTLESFQILLGIIVSKELGFWVRVYVNVGDYRQKREETLMHMAQKAAEKAVLTGRPVELMNLSSSERRVIHLTLQGDDRVTTESEGEGVHRVLLVKPKLT